MKSFFFHISFNKCRHEIADIAFPQIFLFTSGVVLAACKKNPSSLYVLFQDVTYISLCYKHKRNDNKCRYEGAYNVMFNIKLIQRDMTALIFKLTNDVADVN